MLSFLCFKSLHLFSHSIHLSFFWWLRSGRREGSSVKDRSANGLSILSRWSSVWQLLDWRNCRSNSRWLKSVKGLLFNVNVVNLSSVLNVQHVEIVLGIRCSRQKLISWIFYTRVLKWILPRSWSFRLLLSREHLNAFSGGRESSIIS